MLAFPPGIGGTDDFRGGWIEEQVPDAIELLLGFVGNAILPLSWNHGKLFHSPWVSPSRIHVFGFGYGDKVAEGVSHLIAIPFKIAVSLLSGPEDGGDVAGNGWLFG